MLYICVKIRKLNMTNNFTDLLNKKITRFYFEPIAKEFGVDKTVIYDDFIYIETGSIFIECGKEIIFGLGTSKSTVLATECLGINDQSKYSGKILVSSANTDTLNKYIDNEIVSIELNWNVEGWTNYSKNERYLESCILNFKRGESLVLFSATVEIEDTPNSYSFIVGHGSLILFFERATFELFKPKTDEPTEMII